MKYYIKETEDFVSGTMSESQRMTASLKPRVDVDRICGEMIGNAIGCPFPKDTKGVFGRIAGKDGLSQEGGHPLSAVSTAGIQSLSE